MNDENLIVLVRERSALYDLKDPRYMNGNLKGRLWQEIGKEMNIDVIVAVVITFTLGAASGRSLKQIMVTSNFVGEGSNDLTAHLLQSEIKSGLNSAFSPLGTNAILAVLAEGARGETRNQLAKALSLPEDTYAARRTYNTIFTAMSEHGVLNQPEFKSWFYVYKNNSIEESYKTVMREHYLIDIKEVDRYTDIDGEESEQEDNFVMKFSPPAEGSKPQEDSKPQEAIERLEGAASEEKKGDKKDEKDKLDKSEEPKEEVSSEEKVAEESSKKDKESIAQESTSKKDKDEKDAENVTEISIKTEGHPKEDNRIAGTQEDPAADNQENEQVVNILSDETTTVSTSDEATTESISENQVDPTDEDHRTSERPILEDIIARSLKSEIRSQREMVSALSANRLSSLNEDLRPNSRMIIFNALYFRGNWSVPMKSKDEKMPFYISEREEKVDAMSGEGELEMGSVPELGATVLELPYQGEKYSMLIILPDEKDGLGEVVSKLSGISIRNIGQHLTKRLVKACVPKFRFYTISKPKDALLKCGIKDIFGDHADLSGITSSKGLYLDDLVQLVTLDVDESHSSNVQLTSGIVSETRANPALFKADHPFAFVIRDRTDNLVIVAGLVQNPRNPDFDYQNAIKE